VIHRDLKPQNIMIGSFGEVLVLDWGIAKVLSDRLADESEADTIRMASNRTRVGPESTSDTTRGTIIGTRRYMSPEQARGETDKIDPRTDVYSLGAVLYFLLTNDAPAPVSSSSDSFVTPRSANPEVSKSAEAVCMKAMADDPERRYASAAELCADIVHLLDAEPVSAYRENTFEKVGRWVNKNRFLVLLVLAYLAMRMFFILTSR
jgi:serine/threonine protein kinase